MGQSQNQTPSVLTQASLTTIPFTQVEVLWNEVSIETGRRAGPLLLSDWPSLGEHALPGKRPGWITGAPEYLLCRFLFCHRAKCCAYVTEALQVPTEPQLWERAEGNEGRNHSYRRYPVNGGKHPS